MKRQLVVGLFVFGLVTTGCLVCAKHAGTEVNKQPLSNARNNPKPTIIADGNPPPPFPPIKKPKITVVAVPTQEAKPDWLTADGNPPPPFPRFIADGNPPPPFPWFIADGNPPPPFPKPIPLGANRAAASDESQPGSWLSADGNPPPPFPPFRLIKPSPIFWRDMA